MLWRSLLFASVVVGVLASGPSANKLCEDEIKLGIGPKVEVVGTWNERVYTDASVSCSIKNEVCKYKATGGAGGIELIVESLVWSRDKGSSCDGIESAKFRLEPAVARGQFAVIIAIALSGAAVLTVFFGCLAFYAHPDAFWGRILRKKKEQSPRDVSPPESPTEMTDRRSISVTVDPGRSAQ